MCTRHRLSGVIERYFGALRKSQRKTIRDLVGGLLERGKVGLAAIARGMDYKVSVRHHIKRVWRFARNESISLQDVTMCLTAWLAHPELDTVVALDWTALPKGYVMLAAKITVCKRAIPIAWLVLGQRQFDKDTRSRNDAEERLIQRLMRAMGKRPWILVADRGFARADLVGKLQRWGVRFVIRAVGHTWVEGWKFSCILDNVPRTINKVKRYDEVFYQKDKQVPVSLVVAHRETAPEPWYLVTNVAGSKQVVETYRERTWIEESFRDAKSSWGLDELWLARPERIERLLIVMAVAMALAILAALQYRREHGARDPELSTHKRGGTLSVFRIGAELIRRGGLPKGIAYAPLFILITDQ